MIPIWRQEARRAADERHERHVRIDAGWLLAFCVCTCCGATGLRWSSMVNCYRAPCSCSGFADKAGRCVKHGGTSEGYDSCRYVYEFDAEAQG